MKKWFIVLAFIPFLFCSCIHDIKADYQLVNDSSYDVVLKSDCAEYSVKAGESYTVTDHFQVGFKVTDETLRVSSYTYWFNDLSKVVVKDLTEYTYYVFNASAQAIKLSESNNMIGDNYGDSYTIASGETVYIKSFTRSPKWIAVYAVNDKSANLDDVYIEELIK